MSNISFPKKQTVTNYFQTVVQNHLHALPGNVFIDFTPSGLVIVIDCLHTMWFKVLISNSNANSSLFAFCFVTWYNISSLPVLKFFVSLLQYTMTAWIYCNCAGISTENTMPDSPGTEAGVLTCGLIYRTEEREGGRRGSSAGVEEEQGMVARMFVLSRSLPAWAVLWTFWDKYTLKLIA